MARAATSSELRPYTCGAGGALPLPPPPRPPPPARSGTAVPTDGTAGAPAVSPSTSASEGTLTPPPSTGGGAPHSPPPPTRPGASNDWTAIEAGGPASKDWGGTDGVAGSDMDSCSASAALAEGGVEDATAAAIPATASAPSPCTPTAGVSGGSAASGRTPPLAPSGSPTSCAAGEYE